MTAARSTPLVSVIIPCYNAAPWIAQAIDSCLVQTYPYLEVIVIDDGSTDESLSIIKSYGSRVISHIGPNCGRCHARNRGFELSLGEYIQYLDADDYLLPEKIERQVRWSQATGADVVYGDWSYWRMLPDGVPTTAETETAGAHEHLVEDLLAGWWIAPHALLFRRSVIAESGGWDARVEGVEDSLFIIRMALRGVRMAYQPGSCCVYRRHGASRNRRGNRAPVSTVLTLQELVLEALIESGQAAGDARSATAQFVFAHARRFYDDDRAGYERLVARAFELDPTFKPNESWRYDLLSSLVGLPFAERAASYNRRLRQLRARLRTSVHIPGR